MKSMLEVCLVAFALTCLVSAQDQSKPVLRPGIHVQMPVASHAVQVPEADREDATVVSLTADGKLFVGVHPVQLTALSSLNAGTVYVKADERVPFQKILTVLDALNGRSVVLLTARTSKTRSAGIVPPYGVSVSLGDR